MGTGAEGNVQMSLSTWSGTVGSESLSALRDLTSGIGPTLQGGMGRIGDGQMQQQQWSRELTINQMGCGRERGQAFLQMDHTKEDGFEPMMLHS